MVFRVHSVDARPRRPGWVHGRHAVLEVAELRQRRGVEEDLPAAVVLPGFAGDHPAGLDARLARAAGLVELDVVNASSGPPPSAAVVSARVTLPGTNVW